MPHPSRVPAAQGRPGTAVWAEDGILVCYPPIEPGEASLRSYYGAISAALSERAGPYVSITDATGIDRVPAIAIGRRALGR